MDKNQDCIKRLLNEAVNELQHYGERSGKQKVKDALKRAAGRYVPPKDRIFWPAGMLLNTLMMNYEKWEEPEPVLSAVRTCFDRWIGEGMPLYFPDDVLSGEALLDLYERTGGEKYMAGATRMAEFLYEIKEHAADPAGSLPYRPSQKNGHIYADATGMICPFLVRYGVMKKDARAVTLAVAQLKNMLRYGMSDKVQLPYHGYEYESKTRYGIIGWGRAVGWLLLGLAGVLVCLPREHEDYPLLSEEYVNLVKTVSAYQWEDGDFTWQLEAWGGPRDSSATAMIALAVLKGVEAGILAGEDLIGRTLVKRATDFLIRSEKDGRVRECSGECLGYGQYPQIYGAYPWSLAPTLAVLARGKEQV